MKISPNRQRAKEERKLHRPLGVYPIAFQTIVENREGLIPARGPEEDERRVGGRSMATQKKEFQRYIRALRADYRHPLHEVACTHEWGMKEAVLHHGWVVIATPLPEGSRREFGQVAYRPRKNSTTKG
jgi:hypothetical protein